MTSLFTWKRSLRWPLGVTLWALLAAQPFGAQRVAAESDTCAAGRELLTYYKPSALPQFPEWSTRCEPNNQGRCKKIELNGFLFVPTDSKFSAPYPLLIVNHGSEENPGPACAVSSYFRDLGYVVFVPHRRGHGRSTGTYLDEYAKCTPPAGMSQADQTKFCSDFCKSTGGKNACEMEYLHKQVADVDLAIQFVIGLVAPASGAASTMLSEGVVVPPPVARPKLVDRKRIAILGHSFGGIVSVFANTKDLGQRAIVDIAGGSQSWAGNDAVRTELEKAVEVAVTPAFYFEPLNDKAINPTLQLPDIAGSACRIYQSAIFPAIEVSRDNQITIDDYVGDWTTPNGELKTVRDHAHALTMQLPELWGAAVHEFVSRYFQRPTKKFDHLCRSTSIVLEH